jgi:hypothetical protein
MDVMKLRGKAAALDFSFTKGPTKFAGYMLVNNANGDRPLGTDYTSSLAEIERYLADYTDSLDVEVELGSDSEAKPPAPKEIKQALKGNPKAVDIKAIVAEKEGLPRPKLTKEEREAEKRRESALLGTPGQQKAYQLGQAGLPGGMSPEDAAQYVLNSREAKRKQDEIDSEAARKQKPQYFRVNDNTKISVDDPLFAEKQRRESVHKKADELLRRTSISSRKDIDPEDYEQGFYRKSPSDSDDADALPPEGQSGAPAGSTGFAVQTKRQAAQRDRGAAPADALARLKREAKEQRLVAIEPQIKAALLRKDFIEAGRLLDEVKTKLLVHGQYALWLKSVGVPMRTAQRCLAKAKSDT